MRQLTFVLLLDRSDIRDHFLVVVAQSAREDVVFATVVSRDHHAQIAMKEFAEYGKVADAPADVVLN